MKENIHPAYHNKAKASCVCGNKFTVGSTKPEIQVEICYNCHPFYTGKEKLIDTAGKVEKFQARRVKAAEASKSAKLRTKKTVKKGKKVKK